MIKALILELIYSYSIYMFLFDKRDDFYSLNNVSQKFNCCFFSKNTVTTRFVTTSYVQIRKKLRQFVSLSLAGLVPEQKSKMAEAREEHRPNVWRVPPPHRAISHHASPPVLQSFRLLVRPSIPVSMVTPISNQHSSDVPDASSFTGHETTVQK